MKIIYKYARLALSIIVLNALLVDTLPATVDFVRHSELICGNRLMGQVLLCSTPAHKNPAENSGDKHVVRIILAPHTPYDQNTPYYGLERAAYHLEDNRIFLRRLNRTGLQVIISKGLNDTLTVMAHAKSGSRNSAHLSIHLSPTKGKVPILQPGYALNFQAAHVRKVLDGTLAPRWVVEVAIPVEKNEESTPSKIHEKPEWQTILAA